MEVGKYNTKQRQLIYDYISNNKDKHIVVEEVIDFLKQNGSNVGTTTVYRFFNLLEKEGILIKYTKGDGESTCYQFDDEKCESLYHFKCDICGSLLHVKCDELDIVKNHLEIKHNFTINRLKTVFYGTCEKCKA